MKFPRLTKLARRNLGRRLQRTLLTIGGVAAAIALFVLVESLAAGLDRALSGSEAARTLIVYRQNRYCPQTSFLPEIDASRIEKIDGVASVLPVKVYLSNCRASLDVIAFHGVPADEVFDARKIQLIDGDRATFEARGDAALIGESFAARRHLKVGEHFRFGKIDVAIAGVFRSPEPIEESLIVTHLEHLQRSGPVNRLGTVTEFEVKVADPARAKEIAREIDAMLATSEAPTDTRLKLAFLEAATVDLREILRFGRLFGLACVVVVLVLVANTVAMAVRERVREMAVMRTLGFHESHLIGLVVGESLLLALLGAALGIGGALLVVRFTQLTIGVEGVLVTFAASGPLVLRALLVASIAGVVAAALPALGVARARIANVLRGA
jgi:putative ABC transport system permease protein